MLNFQEFLETSTIHGLPRIASSKELLLKIFWFLVIIIGFSLAGSYIHNALQDFEKEPFMTKIETFPISKLKFPSVTVCPPKGYYTNLNYDLAKLALAEEDKKLDENDSLELRELAQELILGNEINKVVEADHKLMMKKRYESWYNNLTKLVLPYDSIDNGMKYEVVTSETVGEIKSPDYGLDFDEKTFMSKLYIDIVFYSPINIININDLTFVLEGEVDTFETVSNTMETMDFFPKDSNEALLIDRGKQNISRSFKVQAGTPILRMLMTLLIYHVLTVSYINISNFSTSKPRVDKRVSNLDVKILEIEIFSMSKTREIPQYLSTVEIINF